jgi:hypothetical protein
MEDGRWRMDLLVTGVFLGEGELASIFVGSICAGAVWDSEC